MNTTYKTYIKPVMKYGSEVPIMASGSTLKALETTQNNALRLITGGVKTTPTLALQLYTGHLPITWEIKQQAVVSMTKMKAVTQTTWTTKTAPQDPATTPQRSSQSSPTIRNTYQRRTHMPNNCPMEYLSFHTNLTLLSEVKKNDTPTTALQQLALATINERFPPGRIPEDIH